MTIFLSMKIAVNFQIAKIYENLGSEGISFSTWLWSLTEVALVGRAFPSVEQELPLTRKDSWFLAATCCHQQICVQRDISVMFNCHITLKPPCLQSQAVLWQFEGVEPIIWKALLGFQIVELAQTFNSNFVSWAWNHIPLRGYSVERSICKTPFSHSRFLFCPTLSSCLVWLFFQEYLNCLMLSTKQHSTWVYMKVFQTPTCCIFLV